ncbi:MAG: DegT/DnrJ/EryC1/StrS family aminotransferase [Ignavibacteria bacterium]|nr:DegT/DnrJ/EryC1/StrS family aminotransferase [Ignavibacteria bacterium]MBK7158119.1 DegT/DnrJ/EryC1/StrS family aminotransferase [Ignavibacteria bacterium]MBK9404177.1 DegT/DnrJ/EryC1/StrS family aminotransferase [Ignavibacteria bacterium]
MNFKIPLFELNFDEAEEKAVIETIRSKWISIGPKTTEFENKFASMLNVKHSIALSNCTVALHLAMKILGIKDGDEVICPSLTFVATVNSIRYVNAIPVFADVKSYDDLTIDPEDIEKKITSKTKAIVVMHYGGFACDMDRIMAIAKKYNLKVIEDSCHGPLSEHQGRKLGTIGDIGCFSFFSNKNISTGEGGMLVTNNPEYFQRAKLLRSHGMTSLSYERSKGHSTSYDVVDLGFNYRMDDIRASIGIVQLDKLENDLKKRAEVRKMYIRELSKILEIIIPFKDQNEFSSNYIFPIILKNSTYEKRDMIRNKLAEAGIQTSVHYPAVHQFSIYKDFYKELPNTDYVADNLITLPMYANLRKDDIECISEKLRIILN